MTRHDFSAADMAGPIQVDLEEAEQCKAIEMIKFLFAFCLEDGDNAVPVCNEQLLGQAFNKVKAIAKRDRTTLRNQLSHL